MIEVKGPQVFLLAEPQINAREMRRYLMVAGGQAWYERVIASQDIATRSDAESLVEFMGRLCYKSWEPGLNRNVTKVREDSGDYLLNILRSAHGSVLAHATFSFVLHDVSRVTTAELNRHAAGTAISEQSLRYVRLNELRFRVPPTLRLETQAYNAHSDRGARAGHGPHDGPRGPGRAGSGLRSQEDGHASAGAEPATGRRRRRRRRVNGDSDCRGGNHRRKHVSRRDAALDLDDAMNLTEATYLLRFLSKRRLAGGLMTMYEEGASKPDYIVMVNASELVEPLDVAELGQAIWLLGFRMMLHNGSILKFEAGPKRLGSPMADLDDVVEADTEEFGDPFSAEELRRAWREAGSPSNQGWRS